MRIVRFITGLFIAAFILGSCANQPPPVTTPAAFSTSNFTMYPQKVRPHEDTTIGIWVKNTGGQTGTYAVEVKVDGNIVKTEHVTLPGGKIQKVTLSVVVPLIGIHDIAVDNFTGTLEVSHGEAEAGGNF